MLNPLKQFIVKPIIKVNLYSISLSLTNSSLVWVYTYILLFLFIKLLMKHFSLKPGLAQTFAEILFNFFNNMLIKTSGKNSIIFFPHIASIFIVILFSNIIGMIPISFSNTSHISVTFTLSMIVFIIVTIIGFFKNGINYFSLLLPKTTPRLLSPLILIIETLVYLSRPISLSVRLAANITAGHVVLKVLATFVFITGTLGIFPFILLIILTSFEFVIAVLQAYIFSILTCVYLNDALNLH
jgi:F-type H+-transporting ATPase subunit a